MEVMYGLFRKAEFSIDVIVYVIEESTTVKGIT